MIRRREGGQEEKKVVRRKEGDRDIYLTRISGDYRSLHSSSCGGLGGALLAPSTVQGGVTHIPSPMSYFLYLNETLEKVVWALLVCMTTKNRLILPTH